MIYEMEYYTERFRWHSKRVGVFIQYSIFYILLSILYIFGFGITRILMGVFGRRLFKPWRVKREGVSYWVDADGYVDDKDRFLKQS